MELYVIGDLQLGDGGNGDDFRADDERALVSFLFRLSRVPGAELVLNGDIIDFTQLQPRHAMWYDELLGSSEDDSLLKLERALQAHGPVWDALGRFAGAGGRLHWIVGDRDADIQWPRVQARLRERITPLGDEAALGFGYFVQRDGVHIQHGHDCDPLASFDPDHWMLLDPRGVPRLERTLGIRFAEEFSTVLDNVDGWEMIDNTLPRIPAALLVLRHALPDRSLHMVLLPAVRVILDSLTMLDSEEAIGAAANRLGISRQSLGWLASVAGWLSTIDGEASLRVPEVASLRRAFAYGAGLEDGAQLAQFAPPALPGVASQLSRMPTAADRRAAARRLYDDHVLTLQYAAAMAARQTELQAICFGHTQRAIDTRMRFDDAPGWPIGDAAARYFNSGCWGRALHIADLAPEQRTASFVAEPAHHRVLRDYLRVEWSPAGVPSVETLAWS